MDGGIATLDLPGLVDLSGPWVGWSSKAFLCSILAFVSGVWLDAECDLSLCLCGSTTKARGSGAFD